MSYSGVCLTVPYFDLYDRSQLEKLLPMLKVIEKISPNKSIPMGDKTAKRHLQKWQADPLNLGLVMSPNNAVVNAQAMEQLEAKKVVENISMPSLYIRAGKDKVVSNKRIQEEFQKTTSQDKQIITYDELDHGIF